MRTILKRKPVRTLNAAKFHAEKAQSELYGIEHKRCRMRQELMETDRAIEKRVLEKSENPASSAYRVSRGYKHYNDFFSQGLSEFFGKPTTLIGALKYAAQKRPHKNRPFVLLEDGSGMGVALSEISEGLREKGIPTHSIALTLTNLKTLEEAKTQGKINEVIVGEAEEYIPKNPVNAIISYAGSISHTAREAKQHHLLKMAYSLERGGIMITSFTYENLPSRSNFLAKNPEKYIQGIAQAFRKKGFKATVTLNHKDWRVNPESKRIYEKPSPNSITTHSHMLILQRL